MSMSAVEELELCVDAMRNCTLHGIQNFHRLFSELRSLRVVRSTTCNVAEMAEELMELLQGKGNTDCTAFIRSLHIILCA